MVGKTHVLAIVGPTGAGKSALAMAAAQLVPIEIVSMDSMQIYRGMDIGTAKPTREEQRQVPHHMLDVAEPAEAISVAQYANLAVSILHEIRARGRLPLLVGGTGLYLNALRKGLPLGGAVGSEEVRNRFRAIGEEPGGKARLHGMLAQVDETAAGRLHVNDYRRVIRALEVYEVTGRPISQQNTESLGHDLIVRPMGVTMERDALYQRINRRVDDMMIRGLLREVESLLKAGVMPGCQSMQGIGYKELVSVLQGGFPEKEAVALVKRNTRRFAKRQWTWFRREDDIDWFDMSGSNGMAKALKMIRRFWETVVPEEGGLHGKDRLPKGKSGGNAV